MRAVILAGGKGTRLRPYTTILPKPLMPIGERPILEIVVDQLRRAGVTRITIAVGHLAGLIETYFGDGARFGVHIDYSLEEQPLGTAGPLALVDPPTDDFVVMNGDILTDLDFPHFVQTHKSSAAIATLATFDKRVHIDLGVIEVNSHGAVTGYTEKPTLSYLVSTGMYVFSPRVLAHIQRGAHCDLPELVLKLVASRELVRTYAVHGYWLDIGRREDYEVALDEYEKGRRW
jgi:NDP-mannose synthase